MKKHVTIIGCFTIIIAILVGFQYWRMAKKGDANEQVRDINSNSDDLYISENADQENMEDSPDGRQDTAIDYSDGYSYIDEAGTGDRSQTDSPYNGEIVFETEYDVKEYCQNCFIVSKNDDLLYGLLDIHGNEILPVKYDSLYFSNAEQVKEGVNDTIYIHAKYEGQHQIFDCHGNQIFDKDVSAIDYSDGRPDFDSAFWFEKNPDDQIARIYKEDRTMMQEINYSQYTELEMKWFSPDYYFATIMDYQEEGSSLKIKMVGTYLYDKNAGLVQQWDGAQVLDTMPREDGLNYFYILREDASYEMYSLDDNGNVELFKTMDRQEVEQEIAAEVSSHSASQDGIREWHLGKEGDIRLYYSNETFKLEDASGNALYDERYYDCYREDGCYILLNEDDQACVINRNGKLVIDYGWIEVNSSQMYFLGKCLDSDHLLDGGDMVGIAIREDELSSVYMFSE